MNAKKDKSTSLPGLPQERQAEKGSRSLTFTLRNCPVLEAATCLDCQTHCCAESLANNMLATLEKDPIDSSAW